MNYVFTGKNMQVSDSLKEKSQKKLRRVEKFLPEGSEVHITFTANKNNTKAEVSIPLHKRILRAEATAPDAHTCLDPISDILEKQIVKYKNRIRERARRNVSTHEETQFAVEAAEPEAAELIIHKTKRFALKPMDATEAVMEMDLLGHGFFVFRNDKTDEINVVYKRNDGEYGLIEPID
jgi:putative sigma-54 modulation protein